MAGCIDHDEIGFPVVVELFDRLPGLPRIKDVERRDALVPRPGRDRPLRPADHVGRGVGIDEGDTLGPCQGSTDQAAGDRRLSRSALLIDHGDDAHRVPIWICL